MYVQAQFGEDLRDADAAILRYLVVHHRVDLPDTVLRKEQVHQHLPFHRPVGLHAQYGDGLLIDTPDEVARDIPLAVLSAVLHHSDPEGGATLKALAVALKDLQERDENTADIFIELIAQGLGKAPGADLWRHLMAVDLSFFQSPLAEEIRDEGRAEGRAEGKAGAILRVLDRRGIDVSDEDRERIASCDDLDMLDLWLDRAITATSASEVFVED
ncbi:hypothetical protein [Streptomyces lutosisoli]|uniref:DUF4351 domain-containing protein n=1 Tax=Streptomyces lutosisoli TaxID=2665721 RepID=A0ABW2VG01_9ACTN